MNENICPACYEHIYLVSCPKQPGRYSARDADGGRHIEACPGIVKRRAPTSPTARYVQHVTGHARPIPLPVPVTVIRGRAS